MILGPNTSPEPDSTLRVFPTALAAVGGLPGAAVDALWRADVCGVNAVAPSRSVQDEIVADGTLSQLTALAAATRDPAVLDGVVDAVLAHAAADADYADVAGFIAANPVLSDSAYVKLSADPATHMALAVRRSARQGLRDAAANPALAETAAAELVAAHEGATVLGLLTADRSSGSVGGYVWGLLCRPPWGLSGRSARCVRDSVLLTAPAALRRELALAMNAQGVPLTAVAAEAVVEAIDAGDLTVDDVVAELDAEGHAWCLLTGGIAAELASAQFPSVKAARDPRKAEVRKSMGQFEASFDEADVLAAIGLADVGARVIFSDDTPIDAQRLDDAINDADVETLVDWAERRQPRLPQPGDVIAQVERMPLARLHDVATEVGRRPDPLEANAELVVALPGVATAAVKSAAAVEAAKYLVSQLGDDQATWTVAVTLMADGIEATLVELAALSLNVTTP